MTLLETDQGLLHYLQVMEAKMTFTDDDLQTKLGTRVSKSLRDVDRIEEHLGFDERYETSVLRASIADLHLQFVLGKMESRKKLHEIKGKLDHRFLKVLGKLDGLAHLTANELDSLKEHLTKNWRNLRLEILLLDARIALAGEQGSETI